MRGGIRARRGGSRRGRLRCEGGPVYTLGMWNRLVIGLLAAVILLYLPKDVQATAAIVDVVPVTPGNIEKYGKFEVAFTVAGSTYSNPYFPYDDRAAAGGRSGNRRCGGCFLAGARAG